MGTCLSCCRQFARDNPETDSFPIASFAWRALFLFQAERKGVSASEYGLVFGIFELVSFLSSPILGKYVSHTKSQCQWPAVFELSEKLRRVEWHEQFGFSFNVLADNKFELHLLSADDLGIYSEHLWPVLIIHEQKICLCHQTSSRIFIKFCIVLNFWDGRDPSATEKRVTLF